MAQFYLMLRRWFPQWAVSIDRHMNWRWQVTCLWVICYEAINLLAFPLVVLGLGFRLNEGWNFVKANPKVILGLQCLPVILIVHTIHFEIKIHLNARRKVIPPVK
jgi:hypothetical protein